MLIYCASTARGVSAPLSVGWPRGTPLENATTGVHAEVCRYTLSSEPGRTQRLSTIRTALWLAHWLLGTVLLGGTGLTTGVRCALLTPATGRAATTRSSSPVHGGAGPQCRSRAARRGPTGVRDSARRPPLPLTLVVHEGAARAARLCPRLSSSGMSSPRSLAPWSIRFCVPRCRPWYSDRLVPANVSAECCP